MQRNENKRQLFAYILIGVTTTLLNIGIFYFINKRIDYRYANLIAIITSKCYAFWGNKVVVFRNHNSSMADFMKELILYVITRGMTGFIDYFGLILLVNVLAADKMFSKIFITILVIALNYVCGKYIVFKK